MGNVSATGTEYCNNTDKLLKLLFASDFPQPVKDTLEKHFKDAVWESIGYKDKYGHGVSVKFVFTNVAGESYLDQDEIKIVSGKKKSDPYTHFPNTISPCDSSGGFHAKRDAAACGSAGAITFSVKDKDHKTYAHVGIAWCQPYSGLFRCHSTIEEHWIDASKLAHDCESGRTGTSDGGSCRVPKLYKDIISCYLTPAEGSTAELFVYIKTDSLIGRVTKGYSLAD